jgi:hypothetical protein
MAGKKPGTNASGEIVLFDVTYEDGTQLSNRRVPASMLGGLDKDEPAIAHIKAEDRPHRPALRQGARKDQDDQAVGGEGERGLGEPAIREALAEESGSRRKSSRQIIKHSPLSLDTDDHRESRRQRLDARLAKSRRHHPADAVGAAEVEPAAAQHQHVEAGEEALHGGTPFVVDQTLVNDEGAAGRERLGRFREEHLLRRKIPIVQHAPHHQHIRAGQRVPEEIAAVKTQTLG